MVADRRKKGKVQTPKGHALASGNAARRTAADRGDHRNIAASVFVSVEGMDVGMADVAVVTVVVGFGKAANVDIVCSAALKSSTVAVAYAVIVAFVSATVGVEAVGTS